MPPGELHLGLESATRLRVVIDHVVDQHADADLAVLTGDLAKGGAERLILLGTHEPDRVGGLLCGHRLAWLRRRLIDVPNQLVTLYMHHLPMCFGVAHVESICLAEPEPFFEFLRDHLSRVRRVVFGHINLPLSGVLEGGIPFWAGRRCNHQLILALDDLQPTGLSPAPTTASSDWRRLTPVSMPSISSAFSRSAEPALAPVFDPDIQPFRVTEIGWQGVLRGLV